MYFWMRSRISRLAMAQLRLVEARSLARGGYPDRACSHRICPCGRSMRSQHGPHRAPAEKSCASDILQQGVEIQGGASPEIQCMRLQKDLRGPSPLIVQQGEEFPFRVELGGRAELGQHLARDAVDAHAGCAPSLLPGLATCRSTAIMRS